MEPISITFRFLVTFLASMLFGLERQRAHKPIGFGTYAFVAVGSCGLAIVSEILAPENPLSLLGAIITGIGFLGAGAMIKLNDKIFGATTAASIWIFAAFGLIVGTGEYLTALFIYVFVWIIIIIDRYFERRNIGSYQKKISITTKRIMSIEDIETNLKNIVELKLISLELNKNSNRQTATFLIEGSKEDINNIPKRLMNKKGFESFKIE